jgi:uncharacterized protein YceK
MTRRWAACLTLSLALSGCGTISQWDQSGGPAVYGGVRFWVHYLSGPHETARASGPRPASSPGGDFSGALTILAILDLPWSFLADTVLLPASIPYEVSQGGISVGQSPD